MGSRGSIDESIRDDAWGAIVCSNASPQHITRAYTALQQQCNAAFSSFIPLCTA